MLPSTPESEVGKCGDTPLQERPALPKASSSHRTARHEHRQKLGRKHTPSPDPLVYSKGEE